MRLPRSRKITVARGRIEWHGHQKRARQICICTFAHGPIDSSYLVFGDHPSFVECCQSSNFGFPLALLVVGFKPSLAIASNKARRAPAASSVAVSARPKGATASLRAGCTPYWQVHLGPCNVASYSPCRGKVDDEEAATGGLALPSGS